MQFSISQRTQTIKKCIMFTSKLCFMGKSACYIAVRGIKGDGLGGHLASLKEKEKKVERGGSEGKEGGGTGGGSGKCMLIGSKRILMFTAAFGEQLLSNTWH